MIWFGVIAIVVALGVLIWWGNRRAAQAEDETSYMGEDAPQPFRFTSVVPHWRKR